MLQQTDIQEYQPANILIVDDEEVVCRGCQRIFEEEGYSMEMAFSGREGLEKADSEEFDVIITDLKMPDISGIEVIREIKQKKPDTPVIMITGYASVPTALEAMKLGAHDYIAKPFEPDEIIDAVKHVMKKETEAPAKDYVTSVEQKIIDKEQVVKVLDRAAHDDGFWAEMVDNAERALEQYNLSSEAKAAVMSGDITWIKKHVGELTDAQLSYLLHRLEMEVW